MVLFIDPLFFLFAALMLLTLPLHWLLAAVFAAVFHEGCHWLMLKALGGDMRKIHIAIGGALIESELYGSPLEWMAILAGPVGSISLVFLFQLWPEASLCGLVHGIFNLIPVYPLDGGRLLRYFLLRLWPNKVSNG